jgi:methylisocitrate lyase
LWNREELGEWGADMVLYPLSAFRAMNKAAETVYKSILENGDQKAVVDMMQTRMDLYDYLGYHDYEQKLDALFAEGKNK